MSNTLTSLTSQQYYRGLNRRFDRRAKQLRKAGFTYRLAVAGVAVFTRTRYTKEVNIAAATLLHADKRAWNDTVEQYAIR